VVAYWIAQLVGGFVAVLAVAIVYSKQATNSLDTAPVVGISSFGALVLETVATALFVVLMCPVATDDRAPWKGVMAPLLIGLFIFTAADAIGPASGGSFNPARSLDPVLFNFDFGDLWIYLVGPLRRSDRRRDLVAVRTGSRAPTGGVPQSEVASPETGATRNRDALRRGRRAGRPRRRVSRRRDRPTARNPGLDGSSSSG